MVLSKSNVCLVETKSYAEKSEKMKRKVKLKTEE